MNTRRYILVTLALIVPVLEEILASSNVTWLVQLDLIFIFAIVLLVRDYFLPSLIFVFLASVLTELVSVEPVGYLALTYMLAVTLVYVVSKLTSIISLDARVLIAYLCFLAIQILEFLIAQTIGLEPSFSLAALIVNLLLLTTGILLSASLANETYVFKK